MPLPFNKNLDLKLLDLVRDNPILYNTKHSKYLDFDSREVVWQKIGDALTRPATEFAGIQCQIQFGDFHEEKHKPGFIENLNEYLPETYSGSWGIEKKLLKVFRKHQGLAPLDAKVLYVKTARALPTYGVTFFLVKEKQKDKKKLVPRLLGINAEAILRLDEKTKEILQQWPLTHVKTYHVGKSETFTLNFGDYSDKEYCCKTQHAYRIREILEGYIDIIRRRMLAPPAPTAGDSMAVCHDNVQTGQSTLIQHVKHQPSKLVTETFVGPNRIVAMEQGSTGQQGTTVMTMQQIIQTNQLNNPQKALKGEVGSRGDMSMDCVRKLKRMNSNSVKVVTLLTEPSEASLSEANKLVGCMQEDLVFVEMGVKSTIQQQTIEESKKMLQNEMQDLTNYMNKLSDSLKSGNVDASEAKDAAEKIVDLTTEMYFSHDPKSRRNSELLNRSKKSLIAGEKMDASIRRASFLTSSHAALSGVQSAAATIAEDYSGAPVDESRACRVQQALAGRLGKLNAALALYLTAHSDPNNIDYSAAITSMNTINELMPKLAQEAQQVLSTKDPTTRAELRRDLLALCHGAHGLCALTGTDDHEKMQEACNNYADVADKLIFTFARGKNAQKEDEIIELAKQVGNKTSVLLQSANELTSSLPDEQAAAVDAAGVRAASAARDLLACAQLSAPAIQEPHCQSAVSAAAAGLTSSLHQLAAACKPSLDAPQHQQLADRLHAQEMDVHKALDRLRDAYDHLNVGEDESIPLKERERLKFICSLAGARKNFHDLPYTWGKSDEGTSVAAGGAGVVSELKEKAARRRLSELLPQLNAALAELARATQDQNNYDYETSEAALQTISELMPTIVQDMEAVSQGQDATTRAAMQQHVGALCDAAHDLLERIERGEDVGPAATKLSGATSKLVFLTSPGADKGKEKTIKELSSRAHDTTMELVGLAGQLPADADAQTVADLTDKLQGAQRAADTLVTVAQLTAPSMSSVRCSDAMCSALQQLQASSRDVTAAALQQLPPAHLHYQPLKDTHQHLENVLRSLAKVCELELTETDAVDPGLEEKERKRLQFVKSASAAKDKLHAADHFMKQQVVPMADEDSVGAQRKVCDQLALMNAGVVALVAACADSSRPDYEEAQKAVDTITDLLPPFVKDARALCGQKDVAAQSALQQQLQQLCDAVRDLCHTAPDSQGVHDAAGRYSDAAGKLTYLLSPATDRAREKQIVELSSASCERASALSSVVQALSGRCDPRTCGEAHLQVAAAGDAARVLQTAAQVTAPTISHPQCSKALVSAAERVRAATQEAVTSVSPYITPGADQQQLQDARQQLHDVLDQLERACKLKPPKPAVPVKQDKPRMQFVRSLSAAKGCFNDAHALLQQPLVCESLPEQESVRVQLALADRLAQLNAAIAALTTATADRDHPDYASAQRAVNTITTLMPLLVQDSKKLCGTKSGGDQQEMLQQLQHLCAATEALCDDLGQPQGINDAANKFSNASRKLMFTISPAKDDGKSKQIIEASSSAFASSSQLVSQAQSARSQLPHDAAAELDARSASVADAAKALVTVAQVTAASPHSRHCYPALQSAAHSVQSAAAALADTCRPHVTANTQQQLLGTRQQLDHHLDKLLQACNDAHIDVPPAGVAVSSAELKEKQRLQFTTSLAGVKSCFDEAQQLLQQPVSQVTLPQDELCVVQRQLSDRIARLNAAVAKLVQATADRDHPDYASAQRAVNTITTLMPLLVQDAKTLSATQDGPAQKDMLQQVQQLCDTSRAVCDNVGDSQGLSNAAVQFSVASSDLMSWVSPAAIQEKQAEEEIINLSSASCVHTSELLSQVQALTQQLEGAAASELDLLGARTADAAQSLLTVAQVTSPSISSAECQRSLQAAAHALSASSAALAEGWAPHVTAAQRAPLQHAHNKLADTLDKLLAAIHRQRDQQRQIFTGTLSAASGCFDGAQQQLKQPVEQTLLLQEEINLVQHLLSDRIAQLNAAVARLTAATADRDHPDYASAQLAVNTISSLMPLLVQDAKTLSSTKEGGAQKELLQKVQRVCEASKSICEKTGQPQDINKAASKLSAATSELLTSVLPPAEHDAHTEKQIIDLSASSCARTSELVSQVNALSKQVDESTAAELHQRGANTADAAHALYTVAQVTAPSMSSGECRAAVQSAAGSLRSSAADLTATCRPHATDTQQRQLTTTHNLLEGDLDELMHVCQGAEQEKRRLRFVNSVSHAKGCFDDVTQLLKQPVAQSQLQPEELCAVRHQLCDRLAALNAAIADIAQATADRDHPDYASAQRAVNTITTLMPLLVQDARVLSTTKDGAAQKDMLQQVQQLCDASRAVCDNVGESQDISESAVKFSAASSQVMSNVVPVTEHDVQAEKQIIELSSASCVATSELLSQVQALTQQLEGAAASELDLLGARTADAAQSLLTVAQVTSPSISSAECQRSLQAAAHALSASSAALAEGWAPHVTAAQRAPLQHAHNKLADTLDLLLAAISRQRDRQRQDFTAALSATGSCFDEAQQQLNQPVQQQTLSQEEQVLSQRQLSERIARLNAAVARLATATADRDHPDYASAQRAVNTITTLMPLLVQDAKAVSASMDGPAQKDMLQQVQQLCDASKMIVDNAGQPQGLNEAAGKFTEASSTLMAAVDPAPYRAREKKIMELTSASCSDASSLVSQCEALRARVPAHVSRDIHARTARATHAAHALLTTAKMTAPSMSSPQCQSALQSAAQSLRSSACSLSRTSAPHAPAAHAALVASTQRRLDDNLDKLLTACQLGVYSAVSPQQQREVRIKFVRVVADASGQLNHAETHLTGAQTYPARTQSKSEALQHQLCRRLAMLNVAIAALTAATTDHKNPDYATAERSIITITELMPKVIQESKALSSSKDENSKKAIHQNLKQLYEASRRICDNAADPKKLNESAATFANASSNLFTLVAPADVGTAPGDKKKGPAVPVRSGQKPAVPGRPAPVPAPVQSRDAGYTQQFIDVLRAEESNDRAAVSESQSVRSSQQAMQKQEYLRAVETAHTEMQCVQDSLKEVLSVSEPSSVISPLELAAREQRLQDSLAAAAVHVTNIVAANYADKLDYKAALQPTLDVTKAVTSIVEDGTRISSTMSGEARKAFLNDMLSLCEASRNIAHAANNNNEKLNEAAVAFGGQSTKLLQVVSADVNPKLEREVISRARDIGLSASRLANQVSSVANSASDSASSSSTPNMPPAHVQDVCAAGAQCIDAAGKLIYAAKLVAPTINDSTCTQTLISSADTLSSSLATFSSTWQPLASHPDTQNFTQEARNLELMLEKLKSDLKSGRLGKRGAVDRQVVVDTPLRLLTVQIIDNAREMAEHGELPPEAKGEYRSYCNGLIEALSKLDYATVRCQRAPHDQKRRNDMEIAIQDLQMMVLQLRPARAGREIDNIVDFRDFLQGLSTECEQLSKSADRYQAATGKRVADDIKLLCTKISEDSTKLLNPTQRDDDESLDDIMDIYEFGQECDHLVKELNSMIRAVPDQKARIALKAKLMPVTENCHLLRFATNSAISTSRSLAHDEVLQDLEHFHKHVLPELLKVHADTQDQPELRSKKKQQPVAESCLVRGRAERTLTCAASRAAAARPLALRHALTDYTVSALQDAARDKVTLQQFAEHMEGLTTIVADTTEGNSVNNSNWMLAECRNSVPAVRAMDKVHVLKKVQFKVLKEEDTEKLLTCPPQKVEGTRNQLEEKFSQWSTKLVSMSGAVLQSINSAESAGRSLHAAADAAVGLANVARALKDHKKPVQSRKIEEAAHEMCLSTYNLLKTSEDLCQSSNHQTTRKKLLEACHQLNEAITRLNRTVFPEQKISRECNDHLRALQLQRCVLQAPLQPAAASPYAHCIDALHSQRDVLLKLNSEEALSREQFLQSLLFTVTAVCNTTECSAHAAYLLSVCESDKSVAMEGVLDVCNLHNGVANVHDCCVRILLDRSEHVIEEKRTLEKQVEELLKDLDTCAEKTNDQGLKQTLTECRKDISFSTKALCSAISEKKSREVITSLCVRLSWDVRCMGAALQAHALAPVADVLPPHAQQHCDDVLKQSTALVSSTQELIKEVRQAPQQSAAIKWSSFSKRREVLAAFDALLNTIKSCGQNVNILEDDSEQKSYVQIQSETAFKWLHKPMAKSDVKANGQQAVKNLIEVGKQLLEELDGADKEELRHELEETEQLLAICCKKYDQEQYSLLMDRVRELQKAVERAAVTRVVEDFMLAEQPLHDLDVLADAEKDAAARQFMLERKIAELLAQLSRVRSTARLVQHTGALAPQRAEQLRTCDEQTNLLAPKLVKAAEERILKADDQAAIEKYQALLAEYTASLGRVRSLCDECVDPMQFVQAAGDTMLRLRDHAASQPSAAGHHTSAAITKLANRVIHVGLSSSSARSDPELQRALHDAQLQLTAATPAPSTRASKLPDWQDTAAVMLRATGEVESYLGGEAIFKQQPDNNQPIYNEALNLHVAIREWSSRDNEIVAVAKRMAVLMAKLSGYMNTDKQHEVLTTSKSIVSESHEVARLAKKLAHECSDHRIKTNLLQVCERIPTISGQLKMLTTVKGSALGQQGQHEDHEAVAMLVGNAQSLMISIQDVVKAAASASVKIMSQRGPKIKWVRKTYY